MTTRARRRRAPKAKPGQLIVTYGRFAGLNDEPDLCASWGGAGASKSDGGMVLYYLNPPDWMNKDESLIKELEARGYDLETLRFSIQRKAQPESSVQTPTDERR